MKAPELIKAWTIDTIHSEAHFKVKHMMVSTVTGSFDEFGGVVKTLQDDFEDAEISFSAKISSINTKNKDRDNHLKSDDFFNAEKFPELLFTSHGIARVDEENYKVAGDLTIRDITKKIELDVTSYGQAIDPYGNTRAGFQVLGTINRKDFGLSWSTITEAGSIVVSDQVRLELNIQLILS